MRWLLAVLVLVAALSPRTPSFAIGDDAHEQVAPAHALVAATAQPAPEAPRRFPLAWPVIAAWSRAATVHVPREWYDAPRSGGADRSLREPMRFHGRRIPRADDGTVPRA